MKGYNLKDAVHQISRRVLAAHAIVVGAAALLMTPHAPAQTVYRVVGPDGKVTFSDKPPIAATNVTATGAGGKPVAGNGPALPFELRQVVSKFPVTLYTANNCTPCVAGRALLSGRGIPFTEKTVNTPEDAEALQRISGESSLPFLTIGGQQIKGYADWEWTQFLNAAGYPTASVLPPNYRSPAATPLVAVQKPAPAIKAEENQVRPAPVAPSGMPADAGSNPAGIKF